MKALIITRHYLDQNLGGPNCSKAFVKAISSIYEDCTLIYPEHNDYVTDMSFITNKTLKLKPCYDNRSKIRKCFDMYRGHIHRFGKFVKIFLRRNIFDVIFIDHSFTASSGVLNAAVKSGSKIVTLHHNVESKYIKDNEQSILFRLPYNYFSLKAECDAIQMSDLNLTLTLSDKEFLSNNYKNKRGSFSVVGIFEYITTKTQEKTTTKDDVFVISGAMNAMQTITAVTDFIEHYVPLLNNLCPNNKLIITGRNPSESIHAAAKPFSNISIVPNPEDIMSVIKKGSYYICPLYTGSGLKLRIMDGLRLGLPVLAHDVSCRGYETIMENGCMFSYTDAESFVTGLKRILATKISQEKVQECFSSYFSYEAGEKRLKEILSTYKLL